MSFDIVNILAVISAILSVVIFWKMTRDYVALKAQNTDIKTNQVVADSDYKEILDATYWLEHERQRNQGEHFDDETVYLNRAQTIRTKTSFFSLVNQ